MISEEFLDEMDRDEVERLFEPRTIPCPSCARPKNICTDSDCVGGRVPNPDYEGEIDNG